LIGLDLDQNGQFAGVAAVADLIQTIHGSTPAPVSFIFPSLRSIKVEPFDRGEICATLQALIDVDLSP
jgi:hypothetical protein